MAEVEKKPLGTIPALAELIAETFPELKGRSIAVSEVEPFSDKSNVPTLPIAVTALVSEAAQQTSTGGGRVEINDDILVQFVFEPTKYQRQDGADTPFYAYYDYEAIRDRLLDATYGWRTPGNGAIAFQSMDVESDEFAVYIAFRFRTTYYWCQPQSEPLEMTIHSRLLQPRGDCCIPCPEKEDPCPT